MTQYPPKTFFLQGIFPAIEVVLQNTRIQTRGPYAGGGGGGVFSRYYIPDTEPIVHEPDQKQLSSRRANAVTYQIEACHV